MNKFLPKLFFVITFICFSVLSTSAQSSAKKESVYQVTFETLDQQEVKPLISLLKPLFLQTPYIEPDQLSIFYYKMDEEIALSELESLLLNTKYELLEFEEINLKAFEKMTQSIVNVKTN